MTTILMMWRTQTDFLFVLLALTSRCSETRSRRLFYEQIYMSCFVCYTRQTQQFELTISLMELKPGVSNYPKIQLLCAASVYIVFMEQSCRTVRLSRYPFSPERSVSKHTRFVSLFLNENWRDSFLCLPEILFANRSLRQSAVQRLLSATSSLSF